MPRCTRCHTTEPERFDSPTAAYCHSCWADVTDYGAHFGRWATDAIDRARGVLGWSPFR